MKCKQDTCVDCGMPHFHQLMFRVHDQLWAEYAPSIDALLCLPCFEKRLGRRLDKTDLTPNTYVNCRVLQRYRSATKGLDAFQREFDLFQQFEDEVVELFNQGKGRDHNAIAELIQRYEALDDVSL